MVLWKYGLGQCYLKFSDITDSERSEKCIGFKTTRVLFLFLCIQVQLKGVDRSLTT